MESATDTKNSKKKNKKIVTLFPLFRRQKNIRSEYDRHRPIDERWTASSEKMSSLTVRILSVNIIAIMILGIGALYLGEYTDSLIESELTSLSDEARFISGALSEGAVRPVFQVSPIPFDDPLKMEAVRTSLARNMMGRLGQSSKSHIRLFNMEGHLLADTKELSVSPNYVQKEQLGDSRNNTFNIGYLFNQSAGNFLELIPTQTKVSKFPNKDIGDIFEFPDSKQALSGSISTSIWKQKDGAYILTAAAPIQKVKQVLGVITLSRDGSALEEQITQIRVDVFRVFLGSLGITVMLSIYLSGLIGKPLKRLALAAEAVRIGKGNDVEIPDMGHRGDEIGELSLVLRDMTQALKDRMDTIERFAADVSHEIKNPLTSLRSAVETAGKIKDEEKRQKLMDIIHHDVRRLDRLITDISSASRLDAELSRTQMDEINLVDLIYQLRDAYKKPMDRVESHTADDAEQIIINIERDDTAYILGNKERLDQVFGNLISNALSFSPLGKPITISLEQENDHVIVHVEDEGPGIPNNKIETIFERFYTERPHENYGNHSGLGLSISKQIIDAHHGEIWAENKTDDNHERCGAIFKVKLQVA